MLIVGSKSQDERLAALVSKDYHNDLKKFRKADLVETIQNWLRKQPHLPQSLTSDEILVFLHACYYSPEKAKETIDNYFTYRMHAPDIFCDRHPKKHISQSLEVAYFVLLPEKCKSRNGNIVIILKMRDPDPARANFHMEVKTCLAVLDFIIARHPFCHGVEVIMDMDGLAFGHVTKIEFSTLRKFMNYIQDAMPIRLKAIHVINTIPLVHQIMAIMKPLIRAELFSLIHFHTTADFENFSKKHISQSVLPVEYGGQEGSMEKYQEQMIAEITMAADWLRELEGYKVDESKRMGRSKWNEINGIAGTFKKLEID